MFICSFPKKEDFLLSEPLEVFNQGQTQKCEAYAATSIAEDHFKVRFDPEVTYANALKISKGKQPSIPDVLESIVQFGLMPLDHGKPSDYKAKSYSRLWGLQPVFDLIRVALAKGYPVICGTYWQQEWDKERDGVIKSNYQNYKLFPHAIKAYGQKTIDGEPRIVVLNSRGSDVGDNGIFYFSRENKLLEPYIIEF